VTLTVANGLEQQTDAAGMSVIRAQSPATLSLRLLHPAFLERETSVRIPDDRPVDLSLIPSTHDLTAFEEFSPRTAGLQRWTRNPRLLVLTHAVDYGGATSGFREYPVIDRPISSTQLSRGAVWLSAETLNFCVTSLLYLHELGHALGYLHVTRTLSIMSPGGLPSTLTDFDRNSIEILFQRRPGNRLPDRDPSGVSVNVAGSAARHDVEPMR
jgi:hypothetical protein